MELHRIGIVGTGFVADLYMRSLETFPAISIVGAYDIDQARLDAFCEHWKVPKARELNELLASGPNSPDLILNLTNPFAHYKISLDCLNAGKHVYSEKPLATDMGEARALCELAASKSLLLASAPCSILGEAAQTLWRAVRQKVIGKPLLVYAQLDDDFVPKAPYKKWKSESGAPWPYRDEFKVGCTLEHAGYYLTWLIAIFGSVEKLVSASANIVEGKLEDNEQTAPDFSCATLFFKTGVVARLTCSIVAPHDHTMKVFGDAGILEIERCWDNEAPVRVRRRHLVRRRLLNSPFTRRLRIHGATHPKVGRWGAASMNFALGPAEMLDALSNSRPCRLSAEFALHLNEVTLAIQNKNGEQVMTTACSPIAPMLWATSKLGDK